MKNYLAIISIIFLFLVLGCNKISLIKKNPNNASNNSMENSNVVKNEPVIKKNYYAAPRNGINLYTDNNINSPIIRNYKQFSQIVTVGKSEGRMPVNGILDYWYKIDDGIEKGWVFGGYLINDLEINELLEKPIYSEDEESFIFSDGSVFHTFEDRTKFPYKLDYIKVYEKTNLESEYFEIYNVKDAGFFKLDKANDWLYFIGNYYDDENKHHGFVYLYDIQNTMVSEYTPEYELIQNHDSIKRFGPVLLIYHNNNIFRFESFSEYGVSYNEELNIIYNYYPDYGEILISKRRFPIRNHKEYLFNLNYNKNTAEGIGECPYFSPSRKYILSIIQDSYEERHKDYSWNTPMLSIFYSDGWNYYEKIFETQTNIYNNDIKNVIWKNDYEVRIEYDENAVLRININGNSDIIFN
jgi:hypothetical protein